MPFGDVDCGGHKEPCVRGGPGIRISPHEESLRCYAWACPDLLVVDIFNVIRKGQQRCGLWLPVLQQCHADFVGDAALCQVSLDELLNQAVSSYWKSLGI